jgi:hypothetical protein
MRREYQVKGLEEKFTENGARMNLRHVLDNKINWSIGPFIYLHPKDTKLDGGITTRFSIKRSAGNLCLEFWSEFRKQPYLTGTICYSNQIFQKYNSDFQLKSLRYYYLVMCTLNV